MPTFVPMRCRMMGILLAVLAAAGLGTARVSAQAIVTVQDSVAVQDSLELDQRVSGFLSTVRTQHGQRIAGFFPTTGEFTYVHTLHRDGADSVTTRRLPSSLASQAIVGGALRASFGIDHHGQPIGLFTHQVILRGTRWRRVSPTRFVPPNAEASSPIFVEWRKEADVWVVSAIGDETFTRRPFPDWCC